MVPTDNNPKNWKRSLQWSLVFLLLVLPACKEKPEDKLQNRLGQQLKRHAMNVAEVTLPKSHTLPPKLVAQAYPPLPSHIPVMVFVSSQHIAIDGEVVARYNGTMPNHFFLNKDRTSSRIVPLYKALQKAGERFPSPKASKGSKQPKGPRRYLLLALGPKVYRSAIGKTIWTMLQSNIFSHPGLNLSGFVIAICLRKKQGFPCQFRRIGMHNRSLDPPLMNLSKLKSIYSMKLDQALMAVEKLQSEQDKEEQQTTPKKQETPSSPREPQKKDLPEFEDIRSSMKRYKGSITVSPSQRGYTLRLGRAIPRGCNFKKFYTGPQIKLPTITKEHSTIRLPECLYKIKQAAPKARQLVLCPFHRKHNWQEIVGVIQQTKLYKNKLLYPNFVFASCCFP